LNLPENILLFHGGNFKEILVSAQSLYYNTPGLEFEKKYLKLKEKQE